MSKDSDYTFGNMTVDCDAPGCKESEIIEGFDNHPPSYSQANDELREMGWVSRKVGSEWLDFCSEHKGLRS